MHTTTVLVFATSLDACHFISVHDKVAAFGAGWGVFK